ncbi:hypothetical protein BT67DRAFT_441391 [Trichocladium antarcticum]|uniref:Uncharacterized protein n=1 Tax=Trichocladium antarcticum TaxID=1450529 RepID=A0AAN6UKZ6_9PEZI|nr:hypothetical protein BT67DRAFT_441391 [Trichocladium antarcticum]
MTSISAPDWTSNKSSADTLQTTRMRHPIRQSSQKQCPHAHWLGSQQACSISQEGRTAVPPPISHGQAYRPTDRRTGKRTSISIPPASGRDETVLLSVTRTNHPYHHATAPKPPSTNNPFHKPNTSYPLTDCIAGVVQTMPQTLPSYQAGSHRTGTNSHARCVRDFRVLVCPR